MRGEWVSVEMTCLVGGVGFGRDDVYEVSYEVPCEFEKLLAITSVSVRPWLGCNIFGDYEVDFAFEAPTEWGVRASICI
jgi:hypothetical protein